MPKQFMIRSFARKALYRAASVAWASTILVGAMAVSSPVARAQETVPPSDTLMDVNALPPAPGLIFDVQAGEYIMFDVLIERLLGRQYILIGEKHDNPIHHHHQAQLVDALSQADGLNRALVWEMFTRDQQGALDQNWQETPIADLGPALQWEERGWPSWHDYAPIAEAARNNDLMMVAGNLPDGLLRPMINDGNAALPDVLATQLDLPEIPSDILERFNTEIADGHCDMLPKNMLGGFSSVQFARDASLAHAMTDAVTIDDVDGAFLIAGAMHVRQTIAVPWHLRRFDPELEDNDIAVVSLIETDDLDDAPANIEDYAKRFGDMDDIDFMWFTNDIERDDPCKDLRIGQ